MRGAEETVGGGRGRQEEGEGGRGKGVDPPYRSICPSHTSCMNPSRGIMAIPTRFNTVLVSTSK